jgi:hypothetical protein
MQNFFPNIGGCYIHGKGGHSISQPPVQVGRLGLAPRLLAEGELVQKGGMRKIKASLTLS